MPYGSPWPMAISAIGSVACATVAFRSQGKLRVTAIVKATFALEDGQPMERIDPEPVVLHDKHHEGNASRSVHRACETAPYQPRCDVLLNGYAVAPMGKRKVSTCPVRLLVQQEATQLIDKRLAVRGDLDPATRQPAPFERLPLVYELAPGGPHVDENPVGVVERPDKPANIYDPRGPGPVGYGAISRRWPVRRKLLGTLEPKRLDALVTDLPVGFPWDYFQAAPADQRLPFLRGDEWVALEGMHPSFARLTSQLPSVLGPRQSSAPEPGYRSCSTCWSSTPHPSSARRCGAAATPSPRWPTFPASVFTERCSRVIFPSPGPSPTRTRGPRPTSHPSRCRIRRGTWREPTT
jgi:hypothetical protein